VEIVEDYVREDNMERLIPVEANHVIDCIDNIDSKTALVAMCYKRGQPIIVSGGAGMKNDTTRLQLRDISECKNDDLISSLRKKLAKMGIRKGVLVAHSQQ
jgi:tRNA A37 threonylcarbamoyladenosine dehydratase